MGLTASASYQIANYNRYDECSDFHLTGDKSSWDEYTLVLQQYSDTSANEDNSFRNHIR